jgi:hypothetical protein
MKQRAKKIKYCASDSNDSNSVGTAHLQIRLAGGKMPLCSSRDKMSV